MKYVLYGYGVMVGGFLTRFKFFSGPWWIAAIVTGIIGGFVAIMVD